MNDISNKEIADFLENYNNWRRDKNTPPSIKMPNPPELGKMIDLAVERLRNASNS